MAIALIDQRIDHREAQSCTQTLLIYIVSELLVDLGQFFGSFGDAFLQIIASLLQFACGSVLIEGEIDTNLEFAGVERLEEERRALGDLGPIHGSFIGEGCEEEDGQVSALPNLDGGLDSIKIALDPDIHQDQVRSVPLHRINIIGTGIYDLRGLVAHEF